MSHTLNQIERAIVEAIKHDNYYTNVKVGTPEAYLLREDNELPLILVSYLGAEPYKKLYPGNMTFSIYFINDRNDRKTIYDMMNDVFEKMQGNSLNQMLNGSFQLQFDKFYLEDADYLIFQQQWLCLSA